MADNPTPSRKVPQSVANSTHAQSILNNNTLSQPQQEDYLQRLMDALEAKNKEHEAAKKSTISLDFILNPKTNTSKSQAQRENEYTRALQQVLQPGQTESQYRQERRYLDTVGGTIDDYDTRYFNYNKALNQQLNQSSDPLYTLDRSMKNYSPTQYSQEELGQIYDRAAQQIIPQGQTESAYRKPIYNDAVKRTWIDTTPVIKSPTSEFSDIEWTRRVLKSRIEALDMKWWEYHPDTDKFTPNCYFWALGLLYNPYTFNMEEGQHGPGFTSNRNKELIDAFAAVEEGTMSTASLVRLLEDGMKSDCQNLGISFRKINVPVSDLNLDMNRGTDLADEYESWLIDGYTEADLKNTEVGQIKSKAQQAEAKIFDNLLPGETLVVLAINPTNRNDMMHFYRRDPDGTWSSKPGMHPIENNIASPITHPELRVFRQGESDNYNIMAVYAIR